MIKKQIVLFIEDDLELRELYHQRLSIEKIDVRLCPDGQTGLDLIQKIQPDVILLDLRLPKLDGFELLKLIKKNQSLAKIPVVVLSALWQDEDKNRALNLGADYYLVKSETKPKDVVTVLNNILKKKSETKKLDITNEN